MTGTPEAKSPCSGENTRFRSRAKSRSTRRWSTSWRRRRTGAPGVGRRRRRGRSIRLERRRPRAHHLNRSSSNLIVGNDRLSCPATRQLDAKGPQLVQSVQLGLVVAFDVATPAPTAALGRGLEVADELAGQTPAGAGHAHRTAKVRHLPRRYRQGETFYGPAVGPRFAGRGAGRPPRRSSRTAPRAWPPTLRHSRIDQRRPGRQRSSCTARPPPPAR